MAEKERKDVYRVKKAHIHFVVTAAVFFVVGFLAGSFLSPPTSTELGASPTPSPTSIQLPQGYYTDAPGVDLSGLTEGQRILALKVMNEEDCPCGCGMSIAECRNEDPQCGTSPGLGARVVSLVKQGKSEDEIKSALGVPTKPTQPTAPVMDVSVDDDPAMGPADAPVTMIVFNCFQCPFSKRHSGTLLQILETYGDKVRIVFRDFPLGFHQYAQKAHEAAECADEQGKFWEYHDKLFENQRALDVASLKQYASDIGLNTAQFNDCLDTGKYASEVQKDMQDGQSYGVRGTPATFVNGRMISGAQPFSAFKAVIDAELEG